MKKILVSIGVTLLLCLILIFYFNNEQLLSVAPLQDNINNIVGVYLENDEGKYESSSDIPLKDSGYQFNKAVCENGIKVKWNENNWSLIVPNSIANFKCDLYFDKEPILKDKILTNNKVNLDTPNFSKTAQASCSSTSKCEETNGIYEGEDDYGITYYFRGSVTNNWVKFAGYYWRIIRINGDGSIRVIYNGTSTATTGSSTVISSSQAFNSSRNRSEYVGYMYTTNEQHGNTTNSDIKTVVDNWYSSNLASYADKISKEAGFCGDREMESGYSWSSTNPGQGYAASGRLVDNKTPSLKCSNSNDLYTVSESSKGNHALTNPVGLVTVDEVAYAGGVYPKTNTSYYLYNNQYYWTMSPYYFGAMGVDAGVFLVYSDGSLLDGDRVDYAYGVRPVINLANDVVIKSGNGTSSTPYEIS